METVDKEQYRVVKSRSRVYRSTLVLKGLYSFNVLLLIGALIVVLIPTVLLLLKSLDNSTGAIVQFIASLGLAFFYPLSFFTLVALFFNLLLIILLNFGVRKDWPILTGAISFLTAVAHTLMMTAVVTLPLVMATDNETLTTVTSVIQSIVVLSAANPSVSILAYFIIAITLIYMLAFLINGTRGFLETLTKTPLSTFFPSGILVESARKEDVEKLQELYYASQNRGGSGKSSYELWKQLMKNVDLERDVRVARLDADPVGFLITSHDFTRVKSAHLTGEAIAGEVEECLLQDFARIYSRSNRYVDFIKVSSSDIRLQRALSHNGWTALEKSSPLMISFHYTGINR